jgi:magnesium transporter
VFSTIFAKRHPKIGARPGTLVIAADAPLPKIRVMHFSPDRLTEHDVADPAELDAAFDPDTISWIDVQGFGDEKLIREIGERFSMHPLAIEDVVNIPQRPKAESYDEHMLIVVRMVRIDEDHKIDIEQVSIVLGASYVLTFQERYGDVLDPVRRRIRSGVGAMRTEGPDYVAYGIFDTIVDGYYPVLEQIGEYLEYLEDEVVERPTPELLRALNRTKNKLTNLRRSLWPQREAANRLCRDEHPLIDANVRLFLRDTYDHCVQTSEVTEMYREIVSGLMNTYLSAVANRTNEVMKVLTVVATIFIPLTFLAGIYGMNFENMPELHTRWGYPLFWVLIGVISAVMIMFFRRRGWLGAFESADDDPPADRERI